MRLSFSRPQRPHTIYVLKSYRDNNGKSTTKRVEILGSEEEIEKKYGCPDGLQWAKDHVAKLNEEEKLEKKKVTVEFSPGRRINPGEQVCYDCGDLMLLPLYSRLGLTGVCESIAAVSKVKYNLGEILEALVMQRLLCPCPQCSNWLGRKRVRDLSCTLDDVYRALPLLSSHIDDLQAAVWHNSQKIMKRNTSVIFYDSIEIDDIIPAATERPEKTSCRGKSRVKMGLLMDADGIPLLFFILPSNEAQQYSLLEIKEMVAHKLGLNEFEINTDTAIGLQEQAAHHEIEQLFSINKWPHNEQPANLHRAHVLRTHVLISFLAMTLVKMLQKQLGMPEVTIARIIDTLSGFKLAYHKGTGYQPLFVRDELTDRLQEINRMCIDTQIVKTKDLNAMYRKALK